MGISRRKFNLGAGSLAATATSLGLYRTGEAAAAKAYSGPNVVIVRFGGGVRRRETIDPQHTYSPFLAHELTRRGTLYKDMRISNQEGVVTSHAEGTLYIITGRYDRYEDVESGLLGDRFEPKVPTLFEYLRKSYKIAAHQALIINGEDRSSEDFLSFSTHHHYGVNYRSSVLSLFRFKTFMLRRQLLVGNHTTEQEAEIRTTLEHLEAQNYRGDDALQETPETAAFWSRWRAHYGDSGLLNPRGDRLLTELALGAIRDLRPKFMMINYQDPDYVHWGNISHYTRAISIIDDGLKQLVTAVDADEEYRDNTVFVIVPDCGRDNNPLTSLSCQHHFNSKSAHEIWALVFGRGIPKGVAVDKPVDQISIARTVASLMGFDALMADAPALAEALG